MAVITDKDIVVGSVGRIPRCSTAGVECPDHPCEIDARLSASTLCLEIATRDVLIRLGPASVSTCEVRDERIEMFVFGLSAGWFIRFYLLSGARDVYTCGYIHLMSADETLGRQISGENY